MKKSMKGVWKKTGILAMGVVMLCALFFSCAQSAAPATPAPQTTPQAKPAAEVTKPVVLKMSFSAPPMEMSVVATRAHAADLEKMTQGRLTVEVYDSSTLAPGPAVLDATQKGAVDIGFWLWDYQASTIPFLDINGLPFLYNNIYGVTAAYDNGLEDLAEQAIQAKGYDNIDLVGTFSHGLMDFGFTDKKVRVPADMKGQKFYIRGPQGIKLVESYGAVVTQVETPQAYDALSRGVVDGVRGMRPLWVEFKWMEPCKYLVKLNQSTSVHSWAVNKKVLQDLPDDLREILIGWLKWQTDVETRDGFLAEMRDSNLLQSNMEYYVPTAAEMELWKAPAKPLIDEWVAQQGDLGKKAIEIVRKYNP